MTLSIPLQIITSHTTYVTAVSPPRAVFVKHMMVTLNGRPAHCQRRWLCVSSRAVARTTGSRTSPYLVHASKYLCLFGSYYHQQSLSCHADEALELFESVAEKYMVDNNSLEGSRGENETLRMSRDIVDKCPFQMYKPRVFDYSHLQSRVVMEIP